MKKLTAWALLLAMCVAMFAGCSNTPAGTTAAPTEAPTTAPAPTEAPESGLASAVAYVKTIYKNAADITAKDYQVVGSVPVGAEVFEITWTVDVAEDVITIVKGEEEPRLATLGSVLRANRAVIEEIHCADMEGMDVGRAGLKGSATKVVKTFTPDRSKQGVKLEGKPAEDAAKELVALLTDKSLIS